MRYLTYDKYIDIGGTLGEAEFNRIIDRVCGIIDIYTQNRLQDSVEVSQNVCVCVRDLCEYINANSGNNGKNITTKSQSAGGVSESESYQAKTTDEFNAEIFCIVYDYLMPETDKNGTPLLYRGCRR